MINNTDHFLQGVIAHSELIVKTGVFIFLAFFVRQVNKFIQDARDRRRILNWVKLGGWNPLYAKSLESVEKGFVHVFGSSLLSMQSLFLCVAIAFAYTLATIPSATINFAMNSTGSKYMLGVCFMATFLAVSLVSGLIGKFPTLSFNVNKDSPIHLRLVGTMLYVLFICVAALIMITLNLYIFYANANFSGTFRDFIVESIEATRSSGRVLSVHQEIPSAEVQQSEANLLKAIFFYVPLVNGFFDYLSLAVTRFLLIQLRHDMRSRSFLAGVKHIVYDIMFAFICSLLLAICIVYVFDKFGVSSGLDKAFFASTDPFSAYALPMTIMILSTFVPTIIHLFFAISCLVAVPPWSKSFLITSLSAKKPSFLQSSFLLFWIISSIGFSLAVLTLFISLLVGLAENGAVFGFPYFLALRILGMV